ncbi:MAG: hypothetical protein DRJ07_11350 [Bacteroidetes bacterium]|nr:MAG: hypothetical protein DRJ07_11350 [Bacteroidota bacterium]
MKIFVKNNWSKVSNFIDYIIQNFKEKGKHYQLKLKAEDVYDKKLINKRVQSLQGKLLLGYEDSFEILEANLLEDFKSFKEEITEIISETDIVDKITEKNFKETVIEFELEFIEKEKVFESLSFKFINLN